MSKYNFEDDEDKYGKTQRLDSINEEIKKYHFNENSSITNDNSEIERKLGDKNNYLNSINSEKIPKNENPKEEFSDKTIVSSQNDFSKDYDSDKFGDTVVLKGELFENKNKNPKPPKKKKGQYKIFMGITLIVGIVVFLAVFIYTFMSFNENKTDTEKENILTTDISDENSPLVVKSINGNSDILVWDIKNEKNYSVNINSDTEIFDSEGTKSSLKNILPGDVINVEFDKDNEKVTKITYPEDFFVLGNSKEEPVYGFKPSEKGDSISSDDKTYKVSDKVDVFYKGQHKSVTDIAEVDALKIKGYDDTVYYIEIFELHGSINIKNIDKVENGQIIIDENEPLELSGIETIPVLEGSHNIVIKGSNINDYTAEIFIVSGESFEIDLSDFQGKKCVLIVKANVDDYNLYIDGIGVSDIESPQVLDEGQYTIRIEKEGYSPWEETVNLSGSSKEVNASLEKLPEEKISFVITTYPADADIYIDDEYVGKSPMNISLEKGSYRFVAKLSGYSDIDRQITVDETTQSIDFSFQ